MPLQGSLKEMSLANLIQVNCQEMRSARLTLTSRGQEGEIFLSDGQVVHATLGNQVGEEAIYAMISWDEGSFVLDLDLVPPARSIKASWEDLLLQGMMQAPARQTGEKQSKENMGPDVLMQLKAIEGVSGAVISACDGVVLGANVPDGDGENEAAVAVFIGSAADQLGQALNLESFVHGVVSLKSRRILILGQPDRYVGLVLGEHASAAIIANAALQVLKK